MQNITYRRAQNSDSEVIKNILKETFEEYAINLPAGYSFSDIEKLEAVALYRQSGFINNAGAKLAPGHDIGLVRDL